jgi:hypothetical protein
VKSGSEEDMTDATIASPADLNRANIAKTAADATAQLAQMAKDFQSSPDYRVEQLEREIDRLGRAEGNGAAVRRATLQSESHRSQDRAESAECRPDR